MRPNKVSLKRFLTFNSQHFAERRVPNDHGEIGHVRGMYRRTPNGVELYRLDGTLEAFVVDNQRQGQFVVSAGMRNGMPFYMRSTSSLTQTWLGLDSMGMADTAAAIRQMVFADAENTAQLEAAFATVHSPSFSFPLPPDDDLLLEGWLPADGTTRDLWHNAVFMRTLGGQRTPYATFDLTILLQDDSDRPWVPVHGGVRMPGMESPREAACALIAYWNDLPDDKKLAAERMHPPEASPEPIDCERPSA